MGVTNTERVLLALCRRSFLSMWSHSGIYRDQGGAKEGKEICDALVVFQNHIIIFSDKEVTYPVDDDPVQNWSRWYRRAIQRSVDQLWGAERWLSNFPERVFSDRACQVRFPIPLPVRPDAVFHRIAVAHGAEEERLRVFGQLSGFAIDPSLVGSPRFDSPILTVGRTDSDRDFVHVVSGSSLRILLTELDTISDFVSYLQAKESLVASNGLRHASSEEDLMAEYLYPVAGKYEHAFPRADPNHPLEIESGRWRSFNRDSWRFHKLREDVFSYIWDEIIEDSTIHILNGTQYFTTDASVAAGAAMLRHMAAESRFQRRYLGTAIRDMVFETASYPQERIVRVLVPEDSTEPYYALLLLDDRIKQLTTDEYRRLRRDILSSLCSVVKLENPLAKTIIGIATEKGRRAFSSQDVVYLDATKYSEDDYEQARNVQKTTGLLTNARMGRATLYEYPHPSTGPLAVPYAWKPSRAKGRDRNKPCQCGSGKKAKHCCLRST